MVPYHKIQTVFKRDPDNNFKTLLVGEYSTPEIEYLRSAMWAFTEKVDGTNIRVIRDKGGIRFAGKTDRAQIPPQLLENLTATFTPERMDDVFGDADLCLYGEGFGAKIQKAGGLYRADQGFVLFDVKIGGVWLDRENVEDIATKLSIEVVPVIGRGTLLQMAAMAEAGFESFWGDFTAEGIVARPRVEILTRRGERIITKIKHRDFAAGTKEED